MYKLIIIMEFNKFEETQQCFLDQDLDEINYLQEIDMKIQISKTIKQRMPANELRTARRPENMAPRTFCLDRPYYLLKDSLNQSCQELVGPSQQGKLKQRIVNSKNLSLQQYFTRKKFQCIYNKLETYRQDNVSFLGKLKGIDSLIDYNWKFYKELEMQINLFNQIKIDKIDSDFQSGNICKAYINTQNIEERNQYNLLIENDLNTYGYNNWFFFRFRNHTKGKRRFNIVNFIKKTSFFSQGMLISIHSAKKSNNDNITWFKGGNKITFNTINILRDRHDNDYYSCLSFEYDFQYEHDEVYFALSQPYTYSRLINFIDYAQQNLTKTKIEYKNIGYSISNNIIPVMRFHQDDIKKNENIILILARQHPCETVGSFIMEAIMKQLLDRSPICQYLLTHFEFVVVPMVNPDGVIHGMSRCNMAGLDLNRQWGDNILKELTPETRRIQQFITNLSKQKKIKYMIDLHGHGKKLNSFFFCCKGNQKEKENYRLLSMSMKKLESRFNIYSCTYGITKDKTNTVRSKINSMGIRQSYTLETSLYGWKNQTNQIKHFNELDYQEIGKSLLSSIFLLEADPSLTIEHLNLTKDIIAAEISTLIEVIEKEERKNSQNLQVLSDSDPEGDRLDLKDLLGKCQNKLMKKKIQQSYAPKQKLKRSKIGLNLGSNRESTQQMRASNYNSISHMTKINEVNSTLRSSALNGSNGLNQTLIKPANKKASFAEKWREKRKQIIQKTKIPDKRRQIVDSLNITHNRQRSRIKTQMSPNKLFIDSVHRKMDSKLKLFESKMKVVHKSQMIQAQKLLHSNSKDLEQQVVLRRSQLDLRFKELKQQSLNILLTNTLSILKISPNKKQSVKQIHVSKNVSIPAREQLTSESRTFIDLSTEQKEDEPSFDNETKKYKKFKHFSNKSTYPKKITKQSNSVFYHFPVL